MNLPKISVITVSFNQGEFIRQNIESVLAQNYPNFEHLIIDGGSTDSTLSVLQEYKHLKWTSEPDRGQSDALNKGFGRAAGEIIAWLNSDDWYAPGIFFDIANELKDYPVVMGKAEQTDREGRTTEIIENTPRSFYDLWRYWVPYAWVAQPSIFFTRKALEESKRLDGTYFDEDLYFTMDSDLWMRLATRYPFTKHINKTLSYFRVYDENKTGAWPLATQRECSRIFRRYGNGGIASEQTLSIVVPAQQSSEELKKTILSLIGQSYHDFEIVISGYCASKSELKELQHFCFKLSEIISHITIRFIKTQTSTINGALEEGLKKSCSPLVLFLFPGDSIPNNLILDCLKGFSRDVVGLILLDEPDGVFSSLFYPTDNTLNVAAPLLMPSRFPRFMARRLLLSELGAFKDSTQPLSALRKILIEAIFKNWSVLCEKTYTISELGFNPLLGLTTQWTDQNSIELLHSLKVSCNQDTFFPIRRALRDPAPLFQLICDTK